MSKSKLNNIQDFEKLMAELKVDAEISCESGQPKSYPCIAVYNFNDDVEFGGVYNLEIVYPSDFL